MKDIDAEWTPDSFINAGYAEIVRGKHVTNGNIDYVFANEKARKMVSDVTKYTS